MQRILFSCAVATIAALAPTLAVAGDKEDKATAEQIATVLRDSGQMQNYSVGVKYKNATVWLSGRVTSEQQMQAALQVISDIEGIDQIVNNLTVAAPAAASTKQPRGSKAGQARRVSATSADLATQAVPAVQPQLQQQQGGGEAIPAGYHHLAARRAAQGRPMPGYMPGPAGGPPAAYDQPHMPNYAWPSYAASPNYAAVTYPKQYSATAWPFIGPFHPYPQVPLGWRKVSLEWDDGWWFLDFQDRHH